MDRKTPTWQIPLGQPPEVVAIGRNAHGFDASDAFQLPDLWSLHLYSYNALLNLDSQAVAVSPGTLGITPPGKMLETRYFGVSVHLYVHFRLAPGPSQPVSAITDLGSCYDSVYQELYDALLRFSQEPNWAVARVWNTLLKAVALSGHAPSVPAVTHRAVRIATDLIERNLDGPICAEDLAVNAGVATEYLSRLFRKEYGETIFEYVRRRRMERASELLRKSTLPIKVVASSVGYSDLQRFNKAVRSHFGMSPRSWRNSVNCR